MIEDIKKIRKEKASTQEEIKLIENAKTLKELGIEFKDALEMLKENEISLILTEEDKVITQNESNFDKIEDCVFIHRTKYLPENGIIKTSKSAGAKSYDITYASIKINGKVYDIETKSGRETIHTAVNGEVSGGFLGASNWDAMKYTIIIPGSEINEDQLVALGPEDSWFKGDYKLPKGTYILVPKDEQEEISKILPDINVVGYEGDPKGYANAFISSMGYKAQNVKTHGWENEDDHKLRALAKEKGIYTGKHCYSKECYQEEREEASNFIVEVFKIIRENKGNFEQAPEIEGETLGPLHGAFDTSFLKSHYALYKKDIPELNGNGTEELLATLSSAGFKLPKQMLKKIENSEIDIYNEDDRRSIMKNIMDGIFISMDIIPKNMEKNSFEFIQYDKRLEELDEIYGISNKEEYDTLEECQEVRKRAQSFILEFMNLMEEKYSGFHNSYGKMPLILKMAVEKYFYAGATDEYIKNNPDIKGGFSELIEALESTGMSYQDKEYDKIYMERIGGEQNIEDPASYFFHKIMGFMKKAPAKNFDEEIKETAEDPKTMKELKSTHEKVKSAALDRTPDKTPEDIIK